MPELPEVETVMRGLRARLEGRRIARVTLHRRDLRWPIPDGLEAALAQRRVLSFRRRGKYILMRCDGGVSLLIHLGMSGRMVLTPPAPDTVSGAEPVRHEHAVLSTDEGWRVALVDPRRFGALDLVPTVAEDRHRLLAGLGPEPLENGFTGPVLRAALGERSTSLKAILLDQKTVAGLGNIYVCEALYRAGLSPLRAAGSVGTVAAGRLVGAIRETLTDAIAAGGSSLRDYVQPDGELGYFQHRWAVYGREGEPCPACPGLPGCGGVTRFVQNGRSSFACPRRQR